MSNLELQKNITTLKIQMCEQFSLTNCQIFFCCVQQILVVLLFLGPCAQQELSCTRLPVFRSFAIPLLENLMVPSAHVQIKLKQLFAHLSDFKLCIVFLHYYLSHIFSSYFRFLLDESVLTICFYCKLVILLLQPKHTRMFFNIG